MRRAGRGRSRLAFRSAVSALVRSLGEVSLRPQGQPAGGRTTLVGDEAPAWNATLVQVQPRRDAHRRRGYGLVSPGSSPSLGGPSRACSRRHQPAECTPTPTSPKASIPTPAIHRMCQKPATTPVKADACATTLAVLARTDGVARPRKTS